MMAKEKPIRFAALIRVSTERQEKKGESLRTQTTFIEHCVKIHSGTLVKYYAGQEHATPAQERAIFNTMLEDAQKPHRAFDAVIVSLHSRWSRDNADSKRGLTILKKNDVRFFVGLNEYKLRNYNDWFMLGIYAEIAEREAAEKNWESIMSRIQRAGNGMPAAGKLPSGRTFDKQTRQWGVDEKKKAMIEDVARRYLAGESLPKLAEEYGVNHSNLHTTLTHRCGDIWEQTFHCDDVGVHKTVMTPIPRLLPEETIKAIRQRAEANRTYLHGSPTNDYLLSGHIFCATCGYLMSPQPSNRENAHTYYRHPGDRERKCPLKPKPYVRCDQIEEAVMRLLFEMLGNPKAVERAIERAIPNRAKIQETRARIERLSEEQKKVATARERILGLVERDAITQKDAEARLNALKAKEAKLSEETARLLASVEHAPLPNDIKSVAQQVATVLKRPKVSAKLWALKVAAEESFEAMTRDEMRALTDRVFNGYDADGKPYGVYIEPVKGESQKRRKRWAFTIKGMPPVDGLGAVTQSVYH
jgi:DNA invertase Pin-like site-specific DNA recombinase